MIWAGAGTWDSTGGPEYGWLYRSRDAGLSWQPVTVTFPISSVTDVVVDPTDSDTVYAATGRRWVDSTNFGSGIVKTTDGGRSWEFANERLTPTNISRLAINPDDPDTIHAGSNLFSFTEDGGMFKSEDGGAHWKQSFPWLRISGLDMDPMVTSTAYAGSYWAGIWQTVDAGETWERVDGPLGHLSSLSLDLTVAPSRTVVYAGVNGGIFDPATARAAHEARTRESDAEFYGSGVYQLTLDHRPPTWEVYLPLVTRD